MIKYLSKILSLIIDKMGIICCKDEIKKEENVKESTVVENHDS